MNNELWSSSQSSPAALPLDEQRAAVRAMLARCGHPLRRALIVPPDITRSNSGAGVLTRLIVEELGFPASGVHVDILPALGTHFPMTDAERQEMFGDLPAELFKVHNWRSGLMHLGEVPAEFIRAVSQGKLEYAINVEIDELLVRGEYDAIFSVGQVVPHEVAGMANGSKNILVGTGGRDTINKTHFLGAVCNMETILGRADNPVRQVFDYADERCLQRFPLVYVQTVVANDADGAPVVQGLFIGTGGAPFSEAAKLCQRLNITMLDAPVKKAVVYLHPKEFKSTWLGNKSVYRTRMAMADDGELIVLAPGVETFGEDREIDRLIRKFGYRGTPATLQAVNDHEELRANLSAAAHLIHGSSEGRFSITYAPGRLTRDEVEGVNFAYGDLAALQKRYNPATLADGWNDVAGERVFFIRNPALGLWALRAQFA
ncbi:DUF2088 domain-containing protein [bacterium]|nr:DUF2088 domain-containing protein [bacterium]